MTRTLTEAVTQCDAVITSGGVSVGDFDYVSDALERIAADDATGASRVDWYQVAIKPAKPLAFGTLGAVPVFGLPGNPVSSRVSFELFARPALRQLAGHGDVLPEPVVAVAISPLPRRADGRMHFDRVRVRYDGGRYLCERAGVQASNVLSGMAAASGLAIVADGDGVEAGETVPVILL